MEYWNTAILGNSSLCGLHSSHYSTISPSVIPDLSFTPLEIMPCCSATGLEFRIIPAGFNAPLEFLTGFTYSHSIVLGGLELIS
jgi:hypothetical protein